LQTSLKAVLFDADGVIQRPAVDYPSAFAALGAFENDQSIRLIREIFAAELPALTGQCDFAQDLTSLLSRWNLGHRLEDVLRIWTSIEADSTMLALVASLRSLGIQCCLATNQQSHRGSYMSETLGYRDMFDFQFYSYQLGLAKPSPEYFRAIVKRLDLDPSDLLFIDDHEPNVRAARGIGIHGSLFGAGTASPLDALRAILSQHNLSLP